MSQSPYMKLDQQGPSQPAFQQGNMKYNLDPVYGNAASQPYTQAPPVYADTSSERDHDQPMFEKKGDFSEAFKITRPKWNDLWAGILFLVFVVAYGGLSGYTLSGWSKFTANGGWDKADHFGVNKNTTGLFAMVVVVAFVVSFVYLIMARLFTKTFIYITGITQIVLTIAAAVFFFYKKQWVGGVFFALAGVIGAWAFYTWIPRIPFSVLMLQTSVDVSKRHGHTYVVSTIGGILGTGICAWYLLSLVAVFSQWVPGTHDRKTNKTWDNPVCSKDNSCNLAKAIGLILFMTFCVFWITEWLRNSIHTTISGVYGSWYFMPNNPPKGATRGAFRRTMTYSFGSVALGSLLVAIINFVQWIVQSMQHAAADEGNWAACIALCIANCLLRMLEAAVEFINRYAFSHIALYGKSYMASAKDTWRMIKNRGIDALINECLINPVLSIGAFFVGVLSALLAYAYLVSTKPEYNHSGDYTVVACIFSFLMGLQICSIFTTPLSSGMDTIFVAMAWEPEVLMRQHPDLYERMVAVFPRVAEKIHA